MSNDNIKDHLLEKETYDRFDAGERLRFKHTLLRLTQEEMAKRINRAPFFELPRRGNSLWEKHNKHYK